MEVKSNSKTKTLRKGETPSRDITKVKFDALLVLYKPQTGLRQSTIIVITAITITKNITIITIIMKYDFWAPVLRNRTLGGAETLANRHKYNF